MRELTAAPDLDGWAVVGGERILQELEAANAFVLSVDAPRTQGTCKVCVSVSV